MPLRNEVFGLASLPSPLSPAIPFANVSSSSVAFTVPATGVESPMPMVSVAVMVSPSPSVSV